MPIRQFVWSLTSRQTSRRRAAAARIRKEHEALEVRAMLAGNVLVALDGADVVITGDAAANSVEIAAVGTTLVVRGLDGTTINGATANFVLSAASTTFAGNVLAELGAGNDRFALVGGTFNSDVTLRGQSGNDTLGINGATLNGPVHLSGGTGTNGLTVQNATLGDTLNITSLGTATVNVSGTTIDGHLHINTYTGNDVIVVSGTTVDGHTWIQSGLGNDDVVIRNSTLHGRLDVIANAGNDVVFIDATTVDRRAHIDGRLGRDNIQIQGASTFRRALIVDGGAGRDMVEIVAPAAADRLRTPASREGNVSDALIAERINHATTGAIAKAAALANQFNPALAVVVAADSVGENAGATATTMTVTRTGDTSAALTVNLASSNTNKATVPATVTIAAGQTTATVNITAVDNDIVDANATVTFTATATGFTNGTDTLVVNNNDTAALTITPSVTSVQESAGNNAVTYTVSRNTEDISQALVVTLTSGTPTRLTVPTTVTIPANSRTATFAGATVNNSIVDGAASVVVTGTATGHANGTATVTVNDDESPTLSASVTPASVSESVGANASVLTVTRTSADNSAELVVTIGLSSSVRLTAPATVTIPAGQNSATVNLATVNNSTVDGNAQITINVTATGFTAGSTTITVTEDDAGAVSLNLPGSSASESAGSLAATITVNQTSASDRTITLSYSGAAGVLTGPATVVIPAGQTSVNLPLNVVNGSVIDTSKVVTIQATSTGLTSDSENLTITDNDAISLTTNIASNTFVQSSGTVITQSPTFTITGTTTPGATVAVDSDNDGQYDDATTTAAVDGTYSVTVPLTHTTANRGAHDLLIRATSGGNLADTSVDVHMAVGSVYRFTTSLGSWDVELLNTAAPITVANFKAYADGAAYNNMFVHRSPADFVIQAGGFKVSGGEVTSVTTNAPITNEFNAANSNLRGTMSMAQLGGQPNSGTSQWFVNVVDNTNLNAAQHTVFGRVIGTGMTVVDAINNLTIRNLNSIYGSSALGEVPLTNFNPANTPLTGTVSSTTGSATVTGVGTSFTTQVQVGDSIRFGNTTHFVQSIQSNTELTLKAAATSTQTGVTATVDVTPNDADFVVFSDISEILSV